METPQEVTREYINKVMAGLPANLALEAFADLPNIRRQYVYFMMHNEWIGDRKMVNPDTLPDYAVAILKCWCCGVSLKECLNVKEDGYCLTPLNIIDPEVLNRMEAQGFFIQDNYGRRGYIPLCGMDYQD